ncbi:MAG: hypothetical protein JNJ91_12935 [Flavobacteriales bacterium]|nr:hypothetical protein [Flavobacteriales bacterium]
MEIARNTGEQPMLVSVEELLGEGQAKSGAHGVPFAYTTFDDPRLRNVTFYVHDHLGNTRVTYTVGCDGSNGAGHLRTLEHAVDYFPYGSILREFVNGQQEKYLTTHHERDVETGLDYRGARYYDSDVARFLSLDPAQAEYPSMSPYLYVGGDPISFVDPTGKNLDKYTVDSEGNVEFLERAEGDDELIVKDDDGNLTDKRITVQDKGLLPSLANNGRYCTTDGQQALGVFNFMADNTNVEWQLNGYDGGTFGLFTSNSAEYTSSATMMPEYEESGKYFTLHSHPCGKELRNENQCASGPWDSSWSLLTGSDRSAAAWGQGKGGYYGTKHFVYHPNTSTLSQYSVLQQEVPNPDLNRHCISTFLK